VADGLIWSSTPLLAAGLLLLVRGRAPGRDAASLIDATIITTGIGMLSWVYLIGPYVRLPDLSLAQRLVSIAYPLGDLLLLAVRLWRAGAAGMVSSRLLAFGLFTLMASDTVYGLSVLNSNWEIDGPIDAAWMLYYVALGLAALHPSMVSLSEPALVNARLTRVRLALLTGASLMASAMLVIRAVRDEPIDVGVIAGGSVVLFLLALARMGGLASEVAAQTERKRAMQTVLRATEQERIRLAADLHDGPVQELTALRYGLTRARNRIQRGQAEQAEGLLAELEDELASGITGLRRLMAELRPAVLDEQAWRWPCSSGSRWSAATSPLTARPARAPASPWRWRTLTPTKPQARGSRVIWRGCLVALARAPSAGAPGGDHRFPDAVGAAVLGEEGEGAGGADGFGGLLALVGREDHDADVGELVDDLGGGFEAVRGGHPEVHQDHVGAERGGHGHPLAPVRGLAHDLDAGVLEHAPQGIADRRRVVHQEDPWAVLEVGLLRLSRPVLFLGHRRLVPT